MANNIFEYKVKLSGDTKGLESQVSKIGAKLTKLEDKDWLIKLDYDGKNIKEFNQKIDKLLKNKELNLPVTFKYEMNKAALEKEQANLKKLENDKKNVLTRNNLKRQISTFKTILSRMNETQVLNKEGEPIMTKIFGDTSASKDLVNQLAKISAIVREIKKSGIQLFDLEGNELDANSFIKQVHELLRNFNSEDTAKIMSLAEAKLSNVQIFDDNLIKDSQKKIDMLKSIIEEVEKSIASIPEETKKTTKNNKFDLGITELDDALQKFAEKIKEFVDVLQQVPKEIENGIVEPLNNALSLETIDNWKNNFINALNEIKNDDFFKILNANKSNNDSALSKLSNILDKIDEADRIISRKYSQEGLKERGFGISSQTGYIHGEYSYDKQGSYNLSNELVKDAREIMNEIIDIVVHTHPNGLYYSSEADIRHDVNEALFGNLKYGLAKGSGTGIQLFDAESFVKDFNDFFKNFNTKSLMEFFKPFEEIVREYKENYYKSNYKPSKNTDLLNFEGFVSSVPKLTNEEKVELDRKAKDYAMKKLLEAFGQDTSNFDFGKYFKNYSSNKDFIADNPLGLSKESSSKFQELIEIKEILIEIKQLLNETLNNNIDDNHQINNDLKSNSANLNLSADETNIQALFDKIQYLSEVNPVRISVIPNVVSYEFTEEIEKQLGTDKVYVSVAPISEKNFSTSGETESLSELYSELKEICNKIEEKTYLFELEEKTVNKISNSEVNSLKKISKTIKDIIDKYELLNSTIESITQNPIDINIKFTKTVATNMQLFIDLIKELDNHIDSLKILKNFNIKDDLSGKLKDLSKSMSSFIKSFENAPNDFIKDLTNLSNSKGLKDLSKVLSISNKKIKDTKNLIEEKDIQSKDKNIDGVTDSKIEKTDKLALEQEKLNNQTERAINNYYELIKKIQTYYSLKAKGQEIDAKEFATLQEITEERNKAINQYGKFSGDKTNERYLEAYNTFTNSSEELVKNFYLNSLNKFKNSKDYSESFIKTIDELIVKLKSLDDLSGETFGDFNKEFEKAVEDSKYYKIADPKIIKYQMTKIQKTLYDSSGMSKKLKEQFEELNEEYATLLNSKAPQKELDQLNSKFQELNYNLHQAGYYGKSVFVKMGEKIRDAFAQAIVRYLSFYDLIRYGREMVQVVTELDSALTQLKIVSGATSTEIENVSQRAYELAKNLGTSTVSIVSSITDWRRLGKSIDESMTLAEQSAKLATGGLMEVSTATEAITSSLQAFDISIEDTSKMVDQFIYLGNNYAITSEELATSLEKSSAALVAAGNTIEQAQAMEIAGNTILQDSDAVANAIKVLSMRLRGTKASELEKAGEDTEGLIESASKLYSTVKNLTKTQSNPEGVSIINKMNGEYKSTYEILKDISKVWDEISDVNRAALLEVIAGKVRASSAAAILQNGDILESAYNDALFNSEGAGQTALDTSLNSIEKKVTILQNKIKHLVQDILDSNTLKDLVDLTSNLVDFVDKLDAPALLSIITGLTALIKGTDVSTIITGIPSLFKTLRSFSQKQYDLNGVKAFLNSTEELKDVEFNVVKDYLKSDDRNSFVESLGSAENATNNYIRTLNSGKESLEQFRTSASRLEITLKSLASSAIIAAVVFAITEIYKAVHEYNDLMIQTGKDAVNTFKEQQKAVDEYKNKIEKLYNVLNDENSTTEEINSSKLELIDIQKELIDTYGDEAREIDLVNASYKEQKETLEEIENLKNSKKLKSDFYSNAKRENKWYDYVLAGGAALDQAILNALDGTYLQENGFNNAARKVQDTYDYAFYQRTELGSRDSIAYANKIAENFSKSFYSSFDKEFESYINKKFSNISINNGKFEISGDIYKSLEELETISELFDNSNFNFEEKDKDKIYQFIADAKSSINEIGDIRNQYLEIQLLESEKAVEFREKLLDTYKKYEESDEFEDEYFKTIQDIYASELPESIKNYILDSIPKSNKGIGRYDLVQEILNGGLSDSIIERIVKDSKNKNFSTTEFNSKFKDQLDILYSVYNLSPGTVSDIFAQNGFISRNADINEIASRLIGNNQGNDFIDEIEQEYKSFISKLDQGDLNLLNKIIGELDPNVLYSVDQLQRKLDKLKEQDYVEISDVITGAEKKVSELTSSLNSAYDAYQKLLNPNITSDELLNSLIELNKASKELGASIPWEKVLSDGKLTAQELSEQIDIIANVEKEKMLDAFDFDSMSPEVQETFKPFLEGLIDTIATEKKAVSEFQNMNSEIDRLQSSFSSLGEIVKSVNSGKALTLDQLQTLLSGEENYIEMLSVENGQLVVNTKKYKEKIAEQLLSYRAQLDSAAAAEINALAENKVAESTSNATAKIVENTGALGQNTQAAIINAMEKGVNVSDIKGVVKKYNTVWNKTVKSFKTGFGGFVSGGSGNDNKEKYKELLDAEIKILDSKLEMSYIDFESYIHKRRDLIEKYYADGLITAKDYYEEIGAMYQAQLAIYDRVIKAVTKTIDKQVKVYQKEQEEIDKQIELLQDANKERQDAIDLQKKLYELERARSQRSRLVYKNGQLQYLNDPQAIRDAQSEINNAILEKKVSELEKQKSAIQELIDSLEEYKEKWQEIADIWDDMKDAQLAEDVLGNGWIDKILNLDPNIYENFKNDYVNLERNIDENNISIAQAAYDEILKAIQDGFGGEGGGGFDFEEENGKKVLQVVDVNTGKILGQIEDAQKYDEEGNVTEGYKQAQKMVQAIAKMTGHTGYDIREDEYADDDEYFDALEKNEKSINDMTSALNNFYSDRETNGTTPLREDSQKAREKAIQEAYDREQQRRAEEKNTKSTQDNTKSVSENIESTDNNTKSNKNLLSFLGTLPDIIKDGLDISFGYGYKPELNASENIAELGSKIGSKLVVDVVANDKATPIFDWINSIFMPSKEVDVEASDSASGTIEDINSEEIEDKTFNIDAKDNATPEIDNVEKEANKLTTKERIVKIVSSVKSALTGIKDVAYALLDIPQNKNVDINVNSGDALGKIGAVAGALSGISGVISTTIQANIDTSGIEEAKEEIRELQKEVEKHQPQNKKNAIKATTRATGTFSEGNAYARGTDGTAGYKGSALVGELGQELLIRNGMFQLIGKHGAEFTDIRPSDIIFNASQTKALLKYGRISTRGKALADGTDFTPLSVSDPKKYEMLNSFVSKIHSNTDIMKGSILNINSSVKELTKQINSANMLYNPTEQTPIINITNPTFQCTGVTGEEVLHQIERSFEGLFVNAYQQSARK